MESSNKAIYLIAVVLGSLIGGYLPVIFGGSLFSLWSIVGSTVVALIFLYLAAKIFNS